MSKVEVTTANGRMIIDGATFLVQGETLYITDSTGKAVAVFAGTRWSHARLLSDTE